MKGKFKKKVSIKDLKSSNPTYVGTQFNFQYM